MCFGAVAKCVLLKYEYEKKNANRQFIWNTQASTRLVVVLHQVESMVRGKISTDTFVACVQ